MVKKKRRTGAKRLRDYAVKSLPRWEDLSRRQRQYKIARAMASVEYFITDPYFLNIPTLFPKQLELAQIITGEIQIEGKKTIRELIVAVGMRSGKTALGSMLACYAAFEILNVRRIGTYFEHLMDGSVIRIANVAKGEEQSKETVFAQVEGHMQNSPYFLYLDPMVSAMKIEFANISMNVSMRAFNSSAAANVGRTLYCIIFDELAKFDVGTNVKTSGWEVYGQLTKSVGSFPLSVRKELGLKMAGNIIVIGSIMHVNDVIMSLVKRAESNPYMYQMVIPTWEFNPKLTWDALAPAREADPEIFWRDYGCVPYASSMQFFRQQDVLALNEDRVNILELLMPHLQRQIVETRYGPEEEWFIDNADMDRVCTAYGFDRTQRFVIAGDPSVNSDHFGFAMGHLTYNYELNRDYYVIDGITRFAPQEDLIHQTDLKIIEINPKKVSGFILSLAKYFRVEHAVFDTYTYVELLRRLREHDVFVEQHTVRLEDYDRLKNHMKDDSIDICNYPFFLEECRQLILKNATRVDHPVRGSKDTSDAVANVLYVLTNENYEWEHVPHHFVAGNINDPNILRGFDSLWESENDYD